MKVGMKMTKMSKEELKSGWGWKEGYINEYK